MDRVSDKVSSVYLARLTAHRVTPGPHMHTVFGSKEKAGRTEVTNVFKCLPWLISVYLSDASSRRVPTEE